MSFLLRVFCPFALGYFISYALRVVNAIIAPQLASDLALDAEALGRLTAAYFFAFSLVQIPLGNWLDRYRPEWVEAVLLCFCGVGCLVFANGERLGGANALMIGRALIGLGVAAGFMAAIRVITYWKTPAEFALYNSLMLAIGSAGALTATLPVNWMLGFMHWSQLFYIFAAMSFVGAIWLGFFTPSGKPQTAVKDPSDNWQTIYQSRQFWLSLPFPALCLGFVLALQSLWATPWLIDVRGFAKADIGAQLASVTWGMFFGNLAWGYLGKYIAERKGSLTVFTGVCGLLAYGLLIALWQLTSVAPSLIFFALGFVVMGVNVQFAGFAQYLPKQVLGRANAVYNVMIFGLTFLCQYGIGWLLNSYPAALGHYQIAGYDRVFSIILSLIFLAGLVFAWGLRRPRRT
jgi:sugar phosphate permease